MEWESEGIILSNKKFIENKIITTVFTKEFGIKKGLTSNRKKRYIIEPGNIVNCRWSARLESHLGYLKTEIIHSITTFCISDERKLTALNSILSVLIKILAENQEKAKIYNEFVILLNKLKASNEYYLQYIKLDLCILKSLGFELELNKCVVTKSEENLEYISPKTGKAVSLQAGEKYKNKLLKFPNILKEIVNNTELDLKVDQHQFAECIKITNYFLKKFIFDDYNFEFPYYRSSLLK